MLPISVKAYNLSDFQNWLSSIIEKSIEQSFEKNATATKVVEVIKEVIIEKPVIVEKIVYVTTSPSLDIQVLLNKINHLENTIANLKAQNKAETVYIQSQCPVCQTCASCPVCDVAVGSPTFNNDLVIKLVETTDSYDIWNITPIGESFIISSINYDAPEHISPKLTGILPLSHIDKVYERQQCINCYTFQITGSDGGGIFSKYDVNGNSYQKIISVPYEIAMPKGIPITRIKAIGQETGMKIGY